MDKTNIEEDIGRVESLVEYGLSHSLTAQDIQAIENILAELERVKEENRALREDYQTENQYYVEKIKEKIKYIKEEGYWEFTTDRDSDKCEEILQELLPKEE